MMHLFYISILVLIYLSKFHIHNQTVGSIHYFRLPWTPLRKEPSRCYVYKRRSAIVRNSQTPRATSRILDNCYRYSLLHSMECLYKFFIVSSKLIYCVLLCRSLLSALCLGSICYFLWSIFVKYRMCELATML